MIRVPLAVAFFGSAAINEDRPGIEHYQRARVEALHRKEYEKARRYTRVIRCILEIRKDGK